MSWLLPRSVGRMLRSRTHLLLRQVSLAVVLALFCGVLVLEKRRHGGGLGHGGGLNGLGLKDRLARLNQDKSEYSDLPDPERGKSEDAPFDSVGQPLAPTKRGAGGVDFAQIKKNFERGRDRPPRQPPANAKKKCPNCQLNARCYKEKHSLWHPYRGCPNIRRFGPDDFSDPDSKCGSSSLSLIFVGDSRIRALFGSVLRVVYDEDEKVHRYLDFNKPQTLSLKNVTSSNYLMAQKMGGLQRDMWTYKYQGNFADSDTFDPRIREDLEIEYAEREGDASIGARGQGQGQGQDQGQGQGQEEGEQEGEQYNATTSTEKEQNFTSTVLVYNHDNVATKKPKRFLFVWDYHLTAPSQILRKEIVAMDAKAVILEAGLWFVWRRKGHWDKFESNLEFAIKGLEKIQAKLNKYFDIIMFLNDDPTRIDEFKLNPGDVDRLNDIVRTVAARHPAVIVWDSYLALQKEYVKYCNTFHIPTDEDFQWRCQDSIHSGLVMYQHYAQQLLNYYCR